MAENEDGQEKSQEPTGKRLDDARKKGQIARSKELNTMAITLLGVAGIMLMGERFAAGLQAIFHDHMVLTRAEILDKQVLVLHLVQGIEDGLTMLLPFFALVVVVAILSSVALGGLNVSFESMQPKLSKLNPIKGMKKVFSVKGLVELVKSLLKFVFIGGSTALLIWHWSDTIILLGNRDVGNALAEGLTMLGWAALLLSSTLILVAAIDVPFQLWDHKRQLKMTQQEVRDEHKETEGRPEVRGRIRQLQREMAQGRMMQEVAQADVIVTNPTHYAVALRYDPETMQAPLLIAKGKDLVAYNIRQVAEGHAIARIEAPLLARAIYFNTELNQPIPTGLFLAVAQLLAYVFQLRAYQRDGGDIPEVPVEFPVPEELQHD